jgi:folate-binding protein YgfZ
MTQETAFTAPGFELVDLFSTPASEYDALRNGAALIDRSARQRMIVAGAKAGETLAGILTSDVLALLPGTGQYAAALTSKGKIIADVRIFARDGDFLVDVAEAAAPGFATMIRKFVNPRLARYADASSILRTIGVFGPNSAGTIALTLGIAVQAVKALSDYAHFAMDWDGNALRIARAPDLGGDGFDIFIPVEAATALWTALANGGATPVGRTAVNIVRIEAGRPLWGIDMDENTLAQEANFDELHGISYTKGCYTGQETVARVHFRGHVNRHLRGLRSTAQLPTGAQLFSDDDKPVGEVRSTTTSPALGAIAIAMVRHEVAPASRLTARWDGGETHAIVHELPFAP